MGSERRETDRYVPKKQTFVALRPDFSKLGKILDISRGGLCFQYMAKEGQEHDSRLVDLDMFSDENGYYLPSVPCRFVYETTIGQAIASPVGLEYRNCGLKFGNLTREQSDQLDLYLRHHTAGSA